MKKKFTLPAKMAGLGLCFLMIIGCTTKQSNYYWGNYESQLYSRFTNSTSPQRQIEEMEKILQTNPGQKPVPPGFHAHLGLLYGDAGRTTEMREQFAIEKQLFPESSTFMDFLLAKSTGTKGNTQ